MNFRMAIFTALLASCTGLPAATTLQSPNGGIRLQINSSDPAGETIFIQDSGVWVPALSSTAAAMRVIVAGAPDSVHPCRISKVSPITDGLLLQGDCGVGSFEQRIHTTDQPDVLTVQSKFMPKTGIELRAVEDRYDFAPGRRDSDTVSSGPVDFVWSQNIKKEADDFIPQWSFKSPVVMLQQGSVFTALMPRLSDRIRESLAMDLDVTSQKLPWLSYGAVESQPHNHSYFRRSPDKVVEPIAGTIAFGHPAGAVNYAYSIVASSQPAKLGYRTVVRYLWSQTGHDELMRSNDLQQNAVRPELVTFDDWRADTWVRLSNQLYHGFDCGGQRCGTISSNRALSGASQKEDPDAWFNAWFQTLRTAYGWYLYGRNTGNRDIQDKAESVLNLALKSPQTGGAFPTVYYFNEKRWLRDEDWAGRVNDYHTMSMSWTAYWMLQWAQHLTPGRTAEILAFARPYGDFLVKQQLPSGVIPDWFDADLKPTAELLNFNSETAASAVFLVQLSEMTGDPAYLHAAERGMKFITDQVLPRQRWFDYETFISCARKPWDFYDKWTAQYPQNNLGAIQAAKGYLALYQATKDPKYLEQGTKMLDYLLLTQQVWNNPAFSPKLVGGFATQNTDAEWSDARQAQAAVMLFDYYQATGSQEYLERAVAAARSTFAIAPWENWAHTGYKDEPGALSSFHWGSGSAMTSIEILAPTLGDAFIDLDRKIGVGFNACSLQNVQVNKRSISFDLETFPSSRKINVRFAGIDLHRSYQIAWNSRPAEKVAGSVLAKDGYTIDTK